MAKAGRKRVSQRLGGLGPVRERRLVAPGETCILRAIEEMRRDLRQVTDVERAARLAIRNAASIFRADDYCFVVVTPGVVEADLIAWTGTPASWNLDHLGAFVRGDRPDARASLALARILRRDRPWGAFALRWDQGHVDWDMRNAFTAFAKGLNGVIADIERDRITDVRDRIDRKIMEQLRSRDLFYKILDGLRSLARYDHSASILIGERDVPHLEVVAEKLAWHRGKSRRVNQRFEIVPVEIDHLFDKGVIGYRRAGATFVSWDGAPADQWLETLATSPCSASPGEPDVQEVLVAPLATPDGLRAVLVVSACHQGTFGAYEQDLLASFLPQVSVALQNSRTAEALESKILETERKHAMADLARSVAHDVNNALGAVVPLLQEMRQELEDGELDLDTLRADLSQIDESVRVCRDIFSGMLRFARTAARPGGNGCARSAVETCLVILGDSLKRERIDVTVDVAEDLPRVCLSQSELDQLMLNLVTNARDAMGSGGRLEIVARAGGDAVHMEVVDDGCGIAPEHLARVQDPFFTTKPTGTGIGLSICRSIVWRSKGVIDIMSEVGEGTRVVIDLPAAGPEGEPPATTTNEEKT